MIRDAHNLSILFTFIQSSTTLELKRTAPFIKFVLGYVLFRCVHTTPTRGFFFIPNLFAELLDNEMLRLEKAERSEFYNMFHS